MANQFGFDDATWKSAKDEARNALIERARLRGRMPYSELVARITSISLEAHDPRLFHLLYEISTSEAAEGRGMLTAIVVHKHGDMQPGPGFFELAKSLGRDTKDILACWISEFNKVHDYWANKGGRA
nr:orf127EGC114 [uncultured bacterium]